MALEIVILKVEDEAEESLTEVDGQPDETEVEALDDTEIPMVLKVGNAVAYVVMVFCNYSVGT